MNARWKAIWTIARREIRGYFDYPTAYILIIAFLGLGLFLTLRSVMTQHMGTLRPFFDLLPWLLALFVPAITMRSLAEERRSRTLEWLMAQPVDETDVVVGKFLGDWIFILVALAGSIPVAIGIKAGSSADLGIMVAQYIGAALLTGQAVAIGLWASAVTRNQITAFILAALLSLVLVLIGLPIVTIGLPPLLSGIVSRLSVLPHFSDVARGVVDLRDVLYFVSTAGLFLVLAGLALSRERLSRGRGAYRRLRIGAAIVVAGVIVLNLLGGYVRGRLDLTHDQLYTLSPGTRTLVSGLQDVVQIKLYVSSQLPPEVQLIERDVRDLLADIRRASNGKLEVIERNPDSSPDVQKEAEGYGIQSTEFNVLRSDELQVKRGWFGLAVVYANQQRSIPVIERTDDLEYQLAVDISAITEASKPKVAFLTGFNARSASDFPTLSAALGDRYQVSSVDLTSTPLGPNTAKVAVLVAPQQPLDDAAVAELNGFLNSGGSALLLLQNIAIQPQTGEPMPARSGLEGFLAARGVDLAPGVVFDLQNPAMVQVGRQGGMNVVRQYPLWPNVSKASDHETTHDLTNLTLFWPAPIVIRDTVHVHPLWKTSAAGGVREAGLPLQPDFFQAPPRDSLHSEVVAVVVDPSTSPTTGAPAVAGMTTAAAHGGRLMVVGDADFLKEEYVQDNPQNLIFVANALDWLAQDDMLIRIRSKHRTPPELVFASDLGRNLFQWGDLVGIPLIVAGFGVWRITRRERRARRRWGGDAPDDPTEGEEPGDSADHATPFGDQSAEPADRLP